MADTNIYDSTVENAWCPGCGNFKILNALKEALAELSLAPHEIVMVSGIGQAAKLVHYLKANVLNGLHGRALPIATGIKIANHKLKVIVTSGDGDLYGEGGNHFIHNIRRNIDITVIAHDNQVYGLTKGQASPTSDPGFKTKVQVDGVILEPVNQLGLAVTLGANFVARSYTGDHDHLKEMMKQAITKKGFSLLDVLTPCISFNKVNTFKWYKERVYQIDKKHDATNKMIAYEKALEWGDKIPIGKIYEGSRGSFTDKLSALSSSTLIEKGVDLKKAKEIIKSYT
ncbi:2-oxoacid:ferredoxin oxidoreductase subunit beta [Thermodesulfobacteriota bacterium]